MPYTILVLLPHSEASDPEEVRDILDDQCNEPSIGYERHGKCNPNEDCGVPVRALDKRGTKGYIQQLERRKKSRK